MSCEQRNVCSAQDKCFDQNKRRDQNKNSDLYEQIFEIDLEVARGSIKEASVERLGGPGASSRSVAPADKHSVGAVDVGREHKPTSADAGQIPWCLVGARVTSAGAPVAVGVMHPMLGGTVALIVVFVALMVIVTALFGSGELSRRAFRLMRWIRNRPEPHNPPGEQ